MLPDDRRKTSCKARWTKKAEQEPVQTECDFRIEELENSQQSYRIINYVAKFHAIFPRIYPLKYSQSTHLIERVSLICVLLKI